MNTATAENLTDKRAAGLAKLRKTAILVKSGQPAADSIEQVRKDAEALKARLLALSPKKTDLDPAIRTEDLDPADAEMILGQLSRLFELADQLRALKSEEAAVKADLKTWLAQHNASAIESPIGRYCAEPAAAYISVVEATVKHTARK